MLWVVDGPTVFGLHRLWSLTLFIYCAIPLLQQAFRELDSDGSGEIESAAWGSARKIFDTYWIFCFLRFFEFVEWFTSED